MLLVSYLPCETCTKVKYCYEPCNAPKQALEFLEKNRIDFTQRDIRSKNPTEDELRVWLKVSGIPLKKIINSGAKAYRELGLKDKLPSMSDDEIIALLATDGTLIKRPILVGKDEAFVLIGYKEDVWRSALLAGS